MENSVTTVTIKPQNKRFLLIGINGSGKTTTALKLAKASGKKIIVLDDIVHPAYSDFDIITVQQLPRWKGTNCVLIIEDIEAAINAVWHNLANAFVIIEDSGRFMNSNIPSSVKTFIINHRKNNFDVAFMFHYLGEVPPYLCKVYNRMVLFKTGDNMTVKQPKWLDWHVITEKHKKVMKSSNINDCVVISR